MAGPAVASADILAAGPSVSSQLLGSGLIGLREGLETGIVVMILVAFLVKAGRRDALKWVWLGVVTAIAVTIGIFLVIRFSAYTVTGVAAEAIAGVASLVAVAIATTMVLWMRKAAAGISGELRSGMARALESGSLAVFVLAFLAVGREGVETALFMVGYAEAETHWPLIGLVIGVMVAAARSGIPGVRHLVVVRLAVVVRRDRPRRLQPHTDPHCAPARSVVGLSRRGADRLPAPRQAPACQHHSRRHRVSLAANTF